MHQKLEAVSNVSIISEDDLSQQFVYVRVTATLPLVVPDGNILEVLQESRKNVSFNFLNFSAIIYKYVYMYSTYIVKCHVLL